MPEDEYGQPIKELRIFSEEPPNISHLHELRKRFPEEELPPDPRVSNMTTLWACKVISAMLDMGESKCSPRIQSLLSLIAIELHWMKRNEREIERKMQNRPKAAIRYERRGRPPSELPKQVQMRLKDVGLKYNHDTQLWSGWQTDEMVIIANELLSSQGRLL